MIPTGNLERLIARWREHAAEHRKLGARQNYRTTGVPDYFCQSHVLEAITIERCAADLERELREETARILTPEGDLDLDMCR